MAHDAGRAPAGQALAAAPSSPSVSPLTGFDPSRKDWSHCGSPYAPEALREADEWARLMRTGRDGRIEVARQIDAAVEAFKLEDEPGLTTPYSRDRLIWQARVHCFNYAMREIKVTDPVFGEGAPFGLPWGLGSGRARLSAVECFQRLAQAIEAGTGETGTGSIREADESAVAESDAP